MCDSARGNDVNESINYKFHFLNRKLITEGYYFTLFLSQEHFRGQVECLSSNRCRYTIFACVVLRKVTVHSLFTFTTVGFPECLLFLDSD